MQSPYILKTKANAVKLALKSEMAEINRNRPSMNISPLVSLIFIMPYTSNTKSKSSARICNWLNIVAPSIADANISTTIV